MRKGLELGYFVLQRKNIGVTMQIALIEVDLFHDIVLSCLKV